MRIIWRYSVGVPALQPERAGTGLPSRGTDDLGDTMMMFGKGISLSGSLGMSSMPAFRIAVPAWRRMTYVSKAHAKLVSRDEILALFADRLKPAADDRLTEAELAQKQEIVRLRRAIYS